MDGGMHAQHEGGNATDKDEQRAEEESLGTQERRREPKHNRLYGTRDYWEDRFSTEESYEWLVSFDRVAHQILPYIEAASARQESHEKDCRILIVGCGNAPFSADLYDAGYKNILNIDYSTTVIESMKARHATARPEMQWMVMDMTQMDALEDASFDVVLDKAAMDALLTLEGDVWNPSTEMIDMARRMCHHVSRILHPQRGIFLQISLVQPHFRKKYLLGWHGAPVLTLEQQDSTYSTEFGWTFEAVEAGAGKSQSGCFGHFLYIMKKRQPGT